MFTGIIESMGRVVSIHQEGSNVHVKIASPLAAFLKIDQSLSHNGVCLTVVALDGDTHTVTAIEETLQRTNLGALIPGDLVNLERAMRTDGRLDGHLVQGHVDLRAQCTLVDEREGSWYFHFQYEADPKLLLVDKGSVCINGVSLTVVHPTHNTFAVAIIPYTYEHTNFKTLQVGDMVNLEFDIIGKYIARYVEAYQAHLAR
jgi:riboflavin synthase